MDHEEIDDGSDGVGTAGWLRNFEKILSRSLQDWHPSPGEGGDCC
jgi:hypothetical protein